MTTLILAFIVMLLLITAMAIGVIAGREPISGSCGGMKALGMDMDCEVCGGDPEKCESNVHPIGRKIESIRTKRVGK
ncbi:MAG: (Na+)-NQR maturation NqrM [Pseudomonadota bacterium]